ncbi:MAG TPA: T9SS type A sorting domain-containing protein [Candidatus Kryptonia bacterium]
MFSTIFGVKCLRILVLSLATMAISGGSALGQGQQAVTFIVPISGGFNGTSITTVTGASNPSPEYPFGNNPITETGNGFLVNIGYRGWSSQSWVDIPNGWTVAHFAPKVTYMTQDTMAATTGIIIQFTNGKVILIKFGVAEGGKDSVYVGEIGTSGSVGWDDIKGDAIYSLSNQGLFVNRDNTLQTWELDSTGLSGAQIYGFALDRTQNVFAATDHGLFTQSPNSNTWSKVTSFTGSSSLYQIFIDRKNRFLVAGNGGGLWLSTDNGSTWSEDTSGIGSEWPSLMSDDAYGNLYTVTDNPFTSVFHLYKSSGGSGSWQNIDGPIRSISVRGFGINSLWGDSALLAATNFGIFISTDQGSTWAVDNEGIPASNIYGMGMTASGTILLSSDLGIFKNTPPTTSWTKSYPQNGFQGQLRIFTDGAGNLFTLDPGLGQNPLGAIPIVKSTDNGSTWVPDTTGLSAVGGTVFYVDETGAEHYCNSLYGSIHYSQIWSKPSAGVWALDTAGLPNLNYSYFSSMTSDHHGYLYASGYFGGEKVARRPIGGGTWTVDTNGLGSAITSFYNMVPGTNGEVVGYNGGILMRRSAGTWTKVPVPSQLFFPSINSVSVDNTGAIFASFIDFNDNGLGVFYTTDNGTTWISVGLDSINVNSLVSFGDSTYALTRTSGAYYVSKTPVTAVKTQTLQPATFSLSQNYPNPFNPSTAISYQLPVVSRVTLRIYDVLGREVAKLIDGIQTSGKHSVTFDASRYASGVYFYKLEATGNDGKKFISTKKLMLIK